MRAVVQTAPGAPLEVQRWPLPQPGPGQVLVRMEAAPINPSDLYLLEGTYKFTRPLPAVPGLEGCGRVVAAGPGLMPAFLRGRRVSCASLPSQGGTWAEYMLTSASLCVPLLGGVGPEQGATLLVNPLTAIALVGMAKKGGHGAIFNTAGASALGKMLIRLGRLEGVPVIPILRRPDANGELAALGAPEVLDSSQPGFRQLFAQRCQAWRRPLILDAVGGALTGALIEAAPEGATVLLYGSLSREAVSADPRHFIFHRKTLSGFYLSDWLQGKNLLQIAALALKVQRLIGAELQSGIRASFPMEQAQEALDAYRADMGGGKVLIRF
jgi:NADPH:quinone reductase-like Zn-dependent oxidoreductase